MTSGNNVVLPARRRRATDNNGHRRRQFILEVLKWSQPILLGLILLATNIYGKAARESAEVAKETAAAVEQTAAAQDTVLTKIASDVDGAKTKVDSLLGVEREHNIQLRAQLQRNGIKPVAAPRQN